MLSSEEIGELMKKYLLISEVSDLLNVPMANLRYLESTHSKIQIQKMRGRRYYRASDIQKIAEALGIKYRAPELAKNKTPALTYTSKKPVITPSVSLVKAPVHSVEKYKPNLPMLEEKHELEIYEQNLPMVAEKHEVVEYESHLPIVAEKHEVEAYKDNLPQLAEKHEVMQLDLFAKIQPASNEKIVEKASVESQKSLAKKPTQRYNTTLEQAKKRLEEIRDRLKEII